MVRISVEVKSGAARFRVMVQAESIERALEVARRHNPDKECRVTFPLDPEIFFVEDSVTKVEETAAETARSGRHLSILSLPSRLEPFPNRRSVRAFC